MYKKPLAAILAATIWISICEFVRNQVLLLHMWENHYEKMGLVFPKDPVNGAVWGIWSLLFAVYLFLLSKKQTYWETVFLGWISGFIFMWLVIGNLGVLPFNILPVAIPFSFVEVFVATLIIKRVVR